MLDVWETYYPIGEIPKPRSGHSCIILQEDERD